MHEKLKNSFLHPRISVAQNDRRASTPRNLTLQLYRVLMTQMTPKGNVKMHQDTFHPTQELKVIY